MDAAPTSNAGDIALLLEPDRPSADHGFVGPDYFLGYFPEGNSLIFGVKPENKFPSSNVFCGHRLQPDMEVATSKLCNQFE